MADQFLIPIPEVFLDGTLDPSGQLGEWARTIHLLLDEITSAEGAIATGEATTEVVLTQQEKLDLIGVTQSVDLDTIESDTASNKSAIDLIATGEPDYVISNDGTQRTLNADAGLIVAGLTYSQTDFQQLIDAHGELADFAATNNRDLQNKDIFG